MNLESIIPKNKNFFLKKDIIYVNNIVDIPICFFRDDILWVFLDSKIIKHVLILIEHLSKNNINFYFRCPSAFFSHKFSNEEFHKKNIDSYLSHISTEKVFYGVYKIGFDFTGNLTKYLVEFEMFEIFKECFTKFKKHSSGHWIDYLSNTKIFNVKDPLIREYALSLERDIKISLLL